jgi:hypothetical protein
MPRLLSRAPHPVAAVFGLALLAAPSAHAGPLDNLRAALRAVADASPVRAELVREVTYQQKDLPARKGQATVIVSQGGNGLDVNFPSEQLARATREHAQLDPDQPRPVSDGLRSIDPVDVAAMLGHARRLLADLEGATLLGDHAAVYRGEPVRMLDVELPVRLSQSGRKRIKHAQSTMKLWLGPDGLPLALEKRSEYRGRIFLVITFEAHESRKLEFARAGDRLVVVREEADNGGSGLGESFGEHRITTLKVL